jgi:lysine biosynthesis protein LysW
MDPAESQPGQSCLGDPPSATTASSENETARQSEQPVRASCCAVARRHKRVRLYKKGAKVVVKKADLAAVAACPGCGDRLALTGQVKLFQRVVCPNCGAELEVVETEPVELEWAYEDYDR